MEAALDLMADGIQLYGPDSSIQFFNRACKRLLDIPPEDSVEGQRLLEPDCRRCRYPGRLPDPETDGGHEGLHRNRDHGKPLQQPMLRLLTTIFSLLPLVVLIVVSLITYKPESAA